MRTNSGTRCCTAAPELLAEKYKNQEEFEKGILNVMKLKAGGDTAELAAFYKQLESEWFTTTEDPKSSDTTTSEGNTEEGAATARTSTDKPQAPTTSKNAHKVDLWLHNRQGR